MISPKPLQNAVKAPQSDFMISEGKATKAKGSNDSTPVIIGDNRVLEKGLGLLDILPKNSIIIQSVRELNEYFFLADSVINRENKRRNDETSSFTQKMGTSHIGNLPNPACSLMVASVRTAGERNAG